jgi:hypothetical protein
LGAGFSGTMSTKILEEVAAFAFSYKTTPDMINTVIKENNKYLNFINIIIP